MRRVENLEDVIDRINKNRKKLQEFGILKIGVFGSFAKNKVTENSDVDLLIEFKRGSMSFTKFVSLIDFLENLFGREVDILTPDGLRLMRSKSARKNIKNSIIYVWT